MSPQSPSLSWTPMRKPRGPRASKYVPSVPYPLGMSVKGTNTQVQGSRSWLPVSLLQGEQVILLRRKIELVPSHGLCFPISLWVEGVKA